MNSTKTQVMYAVGGLAFVLAMVFGMDDYHDMKSPESTPVSIETPKVLTQHYLLTSNQKFNTALLKELPATMEWTDKSEKQVGAAVSKVWAKGVLSKEELAALTLEMENASELQVSEYLGSPFVGEYYDIAKKNHWATRGNKPAEALTTKVDLSAEGTASN